MTPPSARGSATAARIGPNAILQIGAALRLVEGEGTATTVFTSAGLGHRLATPPTTMIEVREVAALHASLIRHLGTERARAVVAEAGRRTAAYLLAHRIPAVFQRILLRLPRAIACRLLLIAIARHAWTFTGGGTFRAVPGTPLRLLVQPCPLCPEAPAVGLGCVFYAATIASLLAALVDPEMQVEPAACGAAGSRRCELVCSRSSAQPP